MIGLNQVRKTYHPGVGVVSLATGAPTFYVLSIVLDRKWQNVIDVFENSVYNFEYRTGVRLCDQGAGFMLHSEMVVLCKIRESKDPERALQIATDVILDYLKQRESSPPRSAAQPQELCAAT